MRCPKCSYISFDEMEICGSCKKNISKYLGDLHGVIFKAEPPDFLWLQQEEEPEPEAEIEAAAAEEDAAGLDMGVEDAAPEKAAMEDEAEEMEFDLDGPAAAEDEDQDAEPQEIEFDLNDEAEDSGEQEEPQEEISIDLAKEDEAPELDLGFDSEEPAADQEDKSELSLDGLDDLDMQFDDADSSPAAAESSQEASSGKPQKEQAGQESAAGLDDLDLSGLMPSDEEKPLDDSLGELGELSLESSDESGAGQQAAKKKAPEKSDDLLSDLSMDGLDLDGPMLPPSSSAAGKKLRPASKTGTALDEFDIDLGSLFGEENEK